VTEFYSPGQLAVIFPYVDLEPQFEPKWLLLGGPADGNEAETATLKWPGIRCIGVEPNPAAYKWQMENCPCWGKSRNRLIEGALDQKLGTISIYHSRDEAEEARRNARRVPDNTTMGGYQVTQVPTYTWDYLDSIYGPFEDAVMWMDIEMMEYPALLGAKTLLARNAIRLINVEMHVKHAEAECLGIDKMLRAHEFKIVGEHNYSAECWDRIYWRRP
jgi:FkbM family methyltransferase